MTASLLKILSSGIQDERLTFQATLYPFRKIWIRGGRFTTQWSRLDFENTPTFGNTAFFRILRKGHLLTRLFLVASMPDIYRPQALARRVVDPTGSTRVYPQFGWTNSLGHALVSQLTLDIAAARVETLDSRLLEILDEYNTPLEKVPVMNELIRRKDHGFTETSFGWPPPSPTVTSTMPYSETVIVPLPFWFTRGDPGCALPIDAIPMDEVRVGITFRDLNGLYYTDTHVPNTSTEDGTSLWTLAGSSFYAQDPTLVSGQTPLSNANGPVQMPLSLLLGECYIMAEYAYLDQNEANRFRLADLQIPVVQHYAMNPYDSRGLPNPILPAIFSSCVIRIWHRPIMRSFWQREPSQEMPILFQVVQNIPSSGGPMPSVSTLNSSPPFCEQDSPFPMRNPSQVTRSTIRVPLSAFVQKDRRSFVPFCPLTNSAKRHGSIAIITISPLAFKMDSRRSLAHRARPISIKLRVAISCFAFAH